MVVGGININPPTPPGPTGITLYESAFFVLCFLQKQRLSKKIFMVGLCSIVINNPFTGTQRGRGGGGIWRG